MELQAFRLSPPAGGGFHFGRQGRESETSAETMSSDSLFAALIAVYAQQSNHLDDFLKGWHEGEPAFVVSSLFPCVGNLPLLPMPRLPVELQDNDPIARKKLKKLAYVSPLIFKRLLGGEWMDDAWSKDGPLFALQGGKVWLTENELGLLPSALRYIPERVRRQMPIWEVTTTPRVTVGRDTNEGNIFFVGRTVFAAGCGLWCCAQVQEQSDILRSLLQELGIRGLGGERNVGYGAYTLHEDLAPLNLPTTAGAKRRLTLARYHPQSQELAAGVLGRGASYELVTVGGWLHSMQGAAQRRKQVRMIEAGSILDVSQGAAVRGQLVDVTPHYPNSAGELGHRVYRSGFALTIGVKEKL